MIDGANVLRPAPSLRKKEALMKMRRFFLDRAGANLVEYIILVGVVALLAIAGFQFFQKSVTRKIEDHAGKVNSI